MIVRHTYVNELMQGAVNDSFTLAKRSLKFSFTGSSYSVCGATSQAWHRPRRNNKTWSHSCFTFVRFLRLTEQPSSLIMLYQVQILHHTFFLRTRRACNVWYGSRGTRRRHLWIHHFVDITRLSLQRIKEFAPLQPPTRDSRLLYHLSPIGTVTSWSSSD